MDHQKTIFVCVIRCLVFVYNLRHILASPFTIPTTFEKIIDQRSRACIRLPIYQHDRLEIVSNQMKYNPSTSNAIQIFNVCHENDDLLATCLSMSMREPHITKALFYTDIYTRWLPMLQEEMPNIVVFNTAIPAVQHVSSKDILRQFHNILMHHVRELSRWTHRIWLQKLQQEEFERFFLSDQITNWFTFSSTLSLNVKRMLLVYEEWHTMLYHTILPHTDCLRDIYVTAKNRMKFSTFTDHVISVMIDSLEYDGMVLPSDRISSERSIAFLLRSHRIVKFMKDFMAPQVSGSTCLSRNAVSQLRTLNYRTSPDFLRAANDILCHKHNDSRYILNWTTANRIIDRHAYEFPLGNRMLVDLLATRFPMFIQVATYIEIKQQYKSYKTLLGQIHPFPTNNYVTLSIFNDYIWNIYWSMKCFFGTDENSMEISTTVLTWVQRWSQTSWKEEGMLEILYYHWYRDREPLTLAHDQEHHGSLEQVWTFVLQYLADHLSIWLDKLRTLENSMQKLYILDPNLPLTSQINNLQKPMIELSERLYIKSKRQSERKSLSPATIKEMTSTHFYIKANYNIYQKLILQDESLLFVKSCNPETSDASMELNPNLSQSSSSPGTNVSPSSFKRHFRLFSSSTASRKTHSSQSDDQKDAPVATQNTSNETDDSVNPGGYWSDG